MNFQKISIIKAITFSIVILLSNHLIFSQTKPNKQCMTNANFKYGVIVELKMNEEVHFEDSLSISLTSFSHKRPYIGGPTKATAYLDLSRDNVSEEIMLSISKDGPSDSEHYDSLLWKEYEIQLMSFTYDKSVEIIIYKKK